MSERKTFVFCLAPGGMCTHPDNRSSVKMAFRCSWMEAPIGLVSDVNSRRQTDYCYCECTMCLWREVEAIVCVRAFPWTAVLAALSISSFCQELFLRVLVTRLRARERHERKIPTIPQQVQPFFSLSHYVFERFRAATNLTIFEATKEI